MSSFEDIRVECERPYDYRLALIWIFMNSIGEFAELRLEGKDASTRLNSLRKKLETRRATGPIPERRGEVSIHIHTCYSFSPYSPAEVVYGALLTGLDAVGIIDHETISGCREMQDAARLIGLPITCGCELRVSATGTRLEGRRINNPDSLNILYMVCHGIPRWNLPKFNAFLRPIRRARAARMERQVAILNEVLMNAGLMQLDYTADVESISMNHQGGSITERHILYALARKMVARFGRGAPLISALKLSLGLNVSTLAEERLSDGENEHLLYDLLGVFKSVLVPSFYQEPSSEECLPVRRVCELVNDLGAIACYPYLGDVGESPTGDKKTESFEDSWLDELFEELPRLGFRALTYMPPRNSIAQLGRVRELCREKNLMEISGVDVNSSRQSFRCSELHQQNFRHLNDSAWALIAHEYLSSYGGFGLFDLKSPLKTMTLKERIKIYAGIGRRIDARRPERIVDIVREEGLWID